jgi:hypothetical protein
MPTPGSRSVPVLALVLAFTLAQHVDHHIEGAPEPAQFVAALAST